METRGFVVPASQGRVWEMAAGRSSALKLLGGRLETHCDGPGADRNWSAPAIRRLPGDHLGKPSG